MEQSIEFVKWQQYYKFGFASKEQLKIVVRYQRITAEEYEIITGEPYAE